MLDRTLGHYRIVAKIGAGGMGEVYRAHDEQLDRDVALKVLPTGALADEAARKQFRREALALAKLNHPNIETVYEFGTQDGVDFLAMELIPGTPLSERLKQGPLLEREVTRLGIQLAEGLAAAHEQGVVHRDLKPANLFITPDGRLKILDFGLAKLLHPTQDFDVTQSITSETGAVSGTVPYMPPEQLRGERGDVRGDIYAAGAVLYEMVTGQRAFPQTRSPELMGAILHQSPSPPSSLNPRTTLGLESVILKALEKEPQQRYQSAGELRVALEGLAAGTAPVEKKVQHHRLLATSAALAVVVLVGATFALNVGGVRERLLTRNKQPGEAAHNPSAPIKARRSIAVLGFKNLSGRPDEAWVSTAVSEMLVSELGAGDQLRTVPGENVARMKMNFSLADEDSYAADTLARIRQNLNADYVVLGSYFDPGKEGGSQVRLDLRLQDATAGETLAVISGKGTEAQLDELVMQVGSQLREKLGIGAVSPAQANEVRASTPANPEAARLYSEALTKLRFMDALGAKPQLEKAISLEPNFAPAHDALASVWTGLGDDAQARREAKKAVDLAGNLPRPERMFIEGRYHELTHEWDQAAQTYRNLFDFSPDNLDYGLSLARSLSESGKPAEGMAVLDALRKLPKPSGDDPRIDLEESRAAQFSSDLKRQLAAAERAVSKATQEGARIVAADGLRQKAGALHLLGNLDAARDAAEQARQVYAAAGDKWGIAWSLYLNGTILHDTGRVPESKAEYEKALSMFRVIGSETGQASTLNATGAILEEQGDLEGARRNYEASLKIKRALGFKVSIANTLVNIANLRTVEGDLPGARAAAEESRRIFTEVGDKGGLAYSLGAQASLLFDGGDLAGAKKTFEQAFAIAKEVDDKTEMAYTLSATADMLAAQDDLAGGRKKYEEATAIRQQMQDKGGLAFSQLSFATLAIEEQHFDEAASSAQAAAEGFRAEKSPYSEALAEATAARALAAQGKLSDAQKKIQIATSLATNKQNRDGRLAVETVVGHVRAASGKAGDVEEASKSLESALAEAKKYGYVPYQFEARLALGEIEMKSGKTAAGRARLAALEKDATAKGFLLIARKAKAASSSAH